MEAPPLGCAVKTPHPCGEVTRHVSNQRLSLQLSYGELARRLLGFSRHRVLDLQPLILTEFLRDALDTLRRQLPANIEVQFEADEEGGVVEADPAAVKQILLHLVTNARDAMPKGGTLHVEVRRARLGAADRPLHAWVEPGSYVSVALSDTGVGMDAQTVARV